MKIETITRIKLTASEGMVLTNGTVYDKEVYLDEGMDTTAFHEISYAEYAQIQAAQEAETKTI